MLDFEEEAGTLVARMIQAGDPVDSVYGIVRVEEGTDRLLDELRGPPGR